MTDKDKINLAIELEKRGKKIITDIELRKKLIRDLHLQGHFGRNAIFNKLWNQDYWWPQIRNDIMEELINCDACARYTVTKSGFHPFTPIIASGPGDHMQVDLSTHLPPSSDGYDTLLVLICVYTGFVILRACKGSTMEVISRKLFKIFCIIGFPRILQSDNGPEFVNKIIRSLVTLTGIEHRLISPYNPRADGKVERAVGSTMMIIKKQLHGVNENWSLYVPFAQLSFNDKISSLTGSSPFSLMFGRSMNQLKDYSNSTNPTPIPLDDWKTHQDKILSLIYPAISDRIKGAKLKLAATLAKHRRIISSESVPPGSSVMLHDPVRNNKFEPTYVGPYTVVRRARNGAYVLKDATGDILDRHVPVDQLKIMSKKPRKADNQIFEVDKILQHRGDPGKYEYLTSWKNHSFYHDSWEPETSFLDDQIIKNYWTSLKKK